MTPHQTSKYDGLDRDGLIAALICRDTIIHNKQIDVNVANSIKEAAIKERDLAQAALDKKRAGRKRNMDAVENRRRAIINYFRDGRENAILEQLMGAADANQHDVRGDMDVLNGLSFGYIDIERHPGFNLFKPTPLLLQLFESGAAIPVTKEDTICAEATSQVH